MSTLRQDNDISSAPSARRLHHGWYVVLTAALVFFFQSGLGGYMLGALQPAWISEFGWPQTWLSSAFALGALIPGLTGVLIGRLVDRYGPRWPVVTGTFIAGLSLILLGAVDSFLLFCVTFCLAAFGRAGMSIIPVSTAITQWFVTRRARAMSIATAGISLAGVILVPVTTWLVVSFGWRTAVIAIGIAFWVLILPPVWFVMDKTPAQRGILPYGAETVSHTTGTTAIATQSLGTVMRNPTFWLVTTSQMVVMIGLSSIGIHIQQSLIDKGVTSIEAAAGVSFLALCSFSSRFFYGWIDSLLPSPVLISLSYTLCALGWATLALIGPGPGVIIFAIILGFGVGGALSLQPVVVADVFGASSYGTILGAVTTPSSLVLAVGPLVSAGFRDSTGSYSGAFLTFSLLCLLGTTLILTAHLRTRRSKTEPDFSTP